MLVHVPHSSFYIPDDSVLHRTLDAEHLTMHTDLYTDLLFKPDNKNIDFQVFKYSRFYCDVERLDTDELEKLGCGKFYEKVPNTNIEIRNKAIDSEEYSDVLKLYFDWHVNLYNRCVREFRTHGECVLVDAHSFSHKQVDYNETQLPDICIGVNSDTQKWLIEETCELFASKGYSVEIDFPFANAKQVTHKNLSTNSIMIEVNKRLYLDDDLMNVDGFKKLHNAINTLYSLIM